MKRYENNKVNWISKNMELDRFLRSPLQPILEVKIADPPARECYRILKVGFCSSRQLGSLKNTIISHACTNNICNDINKQICFSTYFLRHDSSLKTLPEPAFNDTIDIYCQGVLQNFFSNGSVLKLELPEWQFGSLAKANDCLMHQDISC